MDIYRKLANSWRYSIDGLVHAWKTETSIRYEVIMLGLAVVLLLTIRPGPAWSSALLAALLFLIGMELINSSLERAFNLYSSEFHELIKQGKDMASAAILMAIIANLLLWAGMIWDLCSERFC